LDIEAMTGNIRILGRPSRGNGLLERLAVERTRFDGRVQSLAREIHDPGDGVQSNLESDSMSKVLKRPFFRQVERWLVSLMMAAMAYVIEKALLRSIRRGEAKARPHDQSSA
jgi:hypothetical protein